MGLIAVAAETAMTAESAAAGITFGGEGAEELCEELCARVVVRRRGTDVDRAQEDIIIIVEDMARIKASCGHRR